MESGLCKGGPVGPESVISTLTGFLSPKTGHFEERHTGPIGKNESRGEKLGKCTNYNGARLKYKEARGGRLWNLKVPTRAASVKRGGRVP